MQLIDQASAAQFIRAMAPEWTWLLQHIESEDGYVRFPPLFSRLITNLNIENYPALYENEASIGAMMARAFLDPDELKALDIELATLNPEARAEHIEEVMSSMRDAVDVMEIPKLRLRKSGPKRLSTPCPKKIRSSPLNFCNVL